MAIFWSRDIVQSLIEIYGQNECLYNVQSKDYMNRDVRTAAYNSILKELKKKNPAITLDALKKKIRALRAQFSYELKTIESKKRSMGAVAYVPRLWCFEQLCFLTTHTKANTLTEENAEQESSIKKTKGKRSLEDELQKLQSILKKRSISRKSKYNGLAKKVISVLDEIEDNEDQANAVLEIEGVLNKWWQNSIVKKPNDDLSQHSTSSSSNTMPFTEFIKVESPKLDI